MPPTPNPTKTHLFVPTKERPRSCVVCGQGEMNAVHHEGPLQEPRPGPALREAKSNRPNNERSLNPPPAGGPHTL